MMVRLLFIILLFIFFSESLSANTNLIECDSSPIFVSNNCNICYDGATIATGENRGLLSDGWYNNTKSPQIVFKEEQELPQLIPLGRSLWEETKANTNNDFWEYTSEFEKLYDAQYDGYILDTDQEIRWIKSSLGSAYRLSLNYQEYGNPIGLMVYDQKIRQILHHGTINSDTENRRECVIIKSGETQPSYFNAHIEKQAADFLSENSIIESSNDYRTNATITRREMLKIMMNLSGKSVSNTCEGRFSDIDSSDWGCKYAEAALREGYISPNKNFRPDDQVTQSEALKMIMNARVIPKKVYREFCMQDCEISDWKDQYELGARDAFLLGDGGEETTNKYRYFLDSFNAYRGFVFLTSARTYDGYTVNPKYWVEYISRDWRVKYPENWVYRNEGNFILFGPKGDNGLDTFFIRKVTGDYESFIIPVDLGDQWKILSQVSENIQTDSGISGILLTTTAKNSELEEYTFKKVVLKGEDNTHYVLSGELRYLEGFYTSFELK